MQMASLTMRILLALAVMMASVAHGLGDAPQDQQDQDPRGPCLSQRTKKGCLHEHASLLSHCVWCKSKAVPSQCVTPDVAAKLPNLVFKCIEHDDGDDEDEDGGDEITVE